MKKKLIIKIVSGVAIGGLVIVIGTLIAGLLFPFKHIEKNTLFIIGFTMMLLGTLWKVVLEMNKPEDEN